MEQIIKWIDDITNPKGYFVCLIIIGIVIKIAIEYILSKKNKHNE